MDTQSTTNLLNGFVSLDVETADSANSAPCSIAYVLMKNYNIVDEKQFLINPETSFNPIATRIHKITPDMVKDAPTFSQVWPDIVNAISEYPVVCHNVSYDVNVMQKAAARYNLNFPTVTTFCTMKLSQKYLSLDKYRLYNVCNHLGFPIINHHNSLEDAHGCANIMNYFLRQGFDLTGDDRTMLCEHGMGDQFDDFEKHLLREIHSFLIDIPFNIELVRVSKKSFLDLCYYYSCIRFGKLRKGYYILSKENLPYIDGIVADVTKSGNRYFLHTPEDIRHFKDYILNKISEAALSYEDYARMVSEKTVKKHMREYCKSTYPLSKLSV